MDDCIIAIVLTHAAVEGWWHWEQIQAEIEPHKWPAEFQEGLIAVCRARGRPVQATVDAQVWERALDLFAWRNFLQHSDMRARTKLEQRLGREFDPSLLNADLAAEAVETGRDLGDCIASAAGTQRLFDTNWVDPGEL
jgi:hypothetical protein